MSGEPNVSCQSLEEVRANIDRLDREIVRLISERAGFVNQAIRFKITSEEVEAPKRVEQVIEKVRRLAEENGLEPHVAETVYRAMIGAFIQIEHDAVAKRSA